MSKNVLIGLIGDYSESVPAHRAIPVALRLAGETCGVKTGCEWIPTEQATSEKIFIHFDGLWCVPASPYRSMEGALEGIRFAREMGVPFLGTCGGFQHAIVEYARNVLGWPEADHAETAADSKRPVISPLACALVEATGVVRLRPGSRIARAYGAQEVTEGYRCRYGLNPKFRAELLAGPLKVVAEDYAGEVRAIELEGHPFFVATLFQPERVALKGNRAPLVEALVRACVEKQKPGS